MLKEGITEGVGLKLGLGKQFKIGVKERKDGQYVQDCVLEANRGGLQGLKLQEPLQLTQDQAQGHIKVDHPALLL